MDNHYDFATGEWVTELSRYEQVLAEPRFEAIGEYGLPDLPVDEAWALILELIAAVPEDTVKYAGAGPLEDLDRRRAWLDAAMGASGIPMLFVTRGRRTHGARERVGASRIA